MSLKVPVGDRVHLLAILLPFFALSMGLLTPWVLAQSGPRASKQRTTDAISELKQRGEYGPLMDAFRVARENGGSPSFVIGSSAGLTPPDAAAGDQFGINVAVYGNTAVIGAYLADGPAGADQGCAYVFVRSGNSWSQQAKLTASDAAANDRFGADVAIYGDTIVVGAYATATGGSAYVFVRSGTVWNQQQKLIAPDAGADDQFGYAVAIYGDTAVIGANETLSAQSILGQGSAYVFIRNGTAWSFQQKLTAFDGTSDDLFGTSAAIHGDTVAIGSPRDDDAAGVNQGSVYVFTRTGNVWSLQTKLIPADASAGDRFGLSVAISGETMVVGAYAADGSAGVDQGSAYVLVRSGTTWSQQAKLIASDAAAGDRFGDSVSINGNTAVIGAELADGAAGADQGSAYIFVRSGTAWSQDKKLTAASPAAGDQFGFGVATFGDTVLVGAPFADGAVGGDQGSAVVFVSQALAPTAAAVSVSGRILTANGNGLRGARVFLTDSSGATRSTLSGAFGRYQFDGITAGQPVMLAVSSRRFKFQPRTLSVEDSMTDLDLWPE